MATLFQPISTNASTQVILHETIFNVHSFRVCVVIEIYLKTNLELFQIINEKEIFYFLDKKTLL